MTDATDVRPDALERVAWPVRTARLTRRRARPDAAAAGGGSRARDESAAVEASRRAGERP